MILDLSIPFVVSTEEKNHEVHEGARRLELMFL
jgi:hypothetical protein